MDLDDSQPFFVRLDMINTSTKLCVRGGKGGATEALCISRVLAHGKGVKTTLGIIIT